MEVPQGATAELLETKSREFLMKVKRRKMITKFYRQSIPAKILINEKWEQISPPLLAEGES